MNWISTFVLSLYSALSETLQCFNVLINNALECWTVNMQVNVLIFMLHMWIICRKSPSLAHKVVMAGLYRMHQCAIPESECMHFDALMCVRLQCSRSVKLCVAARESGCLNVVRQFLITWPSARAAAEWLTTILEHYWRKPKERRRDQSRPVAEEGNGERWRRMGWEEDSRARKRKQIIIDD